MAEKAKGLVLSDDQKRRRRARNVALACVLGGLVVLFYLLTVFKLGGAVANRAM
jgi:hypothetical protein